MTYTISDSNLHLIDSYKVSKRDFRKSLLDIQAAEPHYQVWNRCLCGMELEWASHNFCYALGIARERTKDCDLNYPQTLIEKIAYPIVGALVWIFIK